MKHHIRDVFVALVDAFGISALYRSLQREKGPLVRVICFHDVANAAWFEEVVLMLVREYHVISPAQFHSHEFNTERINILITFDDGYKTWIDNCLPVLKKHSLKAIFFVNSGLLDAKNREEVNTFFEENVLITAKEPLTWEGARLILAEGHTIGGHTQTHAHLSKLEYAQAYEEISIDKKRLEEVLNVTVTDFAYPFGTRKHYSERTIVAVKDAGYTNQYSALTGFVTSELQAPIHRTLIENNQPTARIRSWINGGYDCFSYFK